MASSKKKMMYLACSDVVINILQLISVHIIKIPNFRHIKKIPHFSDSILVELCLYAFFFWGEQALINSAFALQQELLICLLIHRDYVNWSNV